MSEKILLIGAPIQTGTHLGGCLMGPDAFRTAQLPNHLQALGFDVEDLGNLRVSVQEPLSHTNPKVHHLAEYRAWTQVLYEAAYNAMSEGALPIFLGGDHSMAAGTVSGVAQHTAEQGREQFVLWLDAHPDFHSLDSTESGNLHGTPAAYYTGSKDFTPYLPKLANPVKPQNVCMMGLRSVDRAERDTLREVGVLAHDMRSIDENGVIKPLRTFLDRVKASNGKLHLSLDVDFLDPAIAPAVGTTVPGGATFREAHLIMELLHDYKLVSSLDLVELNPFLDHSGTTARLMVDLVSSLFGKSILDRQTRAAENF
ncbi:arginase [Pseudovibrio sp. SPO723]|uniref:arginase n=1 Tax=Nesiotobacter zosterae TaxID=392721 RepID=UPI0029C12B65|nr:arginase [Pseudovibrio sp. SPO723]MDX5592198.1 arginase [Pseudovibrio sp. SPO723]